MNVEYKNIFHQYHASSVPLTRRPCHVAIAFVNDRSTSSLLTDQYICTSTDVCADPALMDIHASVRAEGCKFGAVYTCRGRKAEVHS